MVMAEHTGVDVGTKLRRAREARGISLRQVAAATKISVSVLEALERNDISRLPGGIFSRAFVRSYAVEIGLDAEQAVRDFIDQFPHDSVVAGSPHVPQEDHEAIESSRQSAQTAVKLVAISLPVVGVILYLTLGSSGSRPPAAPEALAAPGLAAPGAADALTFEIVATAPVTVSIEVDGVRREARLVATGERLVFQAAREMSMTVSDAGAVQISINDQPAVTLGAAGESRSVLIDRANYGSFLAPR
jgi:cytoskeleton protein RodZ